MADWSSSRGKLITQYLHLLKSMSAATSLPVEADIAYWLHSLPAPGGARLDEAIMRSVDAVTVMSYRNNVSGPDGITGVGSQALRTARATHTPCRLAVETMFYGTDAVAKKQTFYGIGRAALRSALDAVDRAEHLNPSYAGVAVHHFDSWRALGN